MIKVNGAATQNVYGETLTAFLTRCGFAPAKVVVELNGTIISQAEYPGVVINDDDALEIVTFVGGG